MLTQKTPEFPPLVRGLHTVALLDTTNQLTTMSLGNYSKISAKHKHNRKHSNHIGGRTQEQERSASAIIRAIHARKANGTYGKCAA